MLGVHICVYNFTDLCKIHFDNRYIKKFSYDFITKIAPYKFDNNNGFLIRLSKIKEICNETRLRAKPDCSEFMPEYELCNHAKLGLIHATYDICNKPLMINDIKIHNCGDIQKYIKNQLSDKFKWKPYIDMFAYQILHLFINVYKSDHANKQAMVHNLITKYMNNIDEFIAQKIEGANLRITDLFHELYRREVGISFVIPERTKYTYLNNYKIVGEYSLSMFNGMIYELVQDCRKVFHCL